MADAVWPTSLTRAPRVDSLEETAPDVVIRTDMDTGPGKVRRRISTNVRRYSWAFDLTRDQVAIFDEFFLTTCAGGAVPFVWTDPRTAESSRFRFVDQPSYKPRAPRAAGGEYWTASCKVEKLGPADPGADSGCPKVTVTDPQSVDHEFSLASTITLTIAVASLAQLQTPPESMEGGPGDGGGTGTFTFGYANVRTRTFVLQRVEATSTSIKWRYPAAALDADAAVVTFTSANGWNYAVPETEDFYPAGAEIGYDTAAFSGAEDVPQTDTPAFRPKDLPALVETGTGGTDPAVLCPGQFTAAMLLVAEATLDNACADAPAARATGFRNYVGFCQ